MNFPFIVTYSITRRCNLKCRHCYSQGGKEGKHELSPIIAKDVVKQIAGIGSRIIIFDGGEPLMREDIFELISFAKIMGLSTVLGTNGTLITRDVARKLADIGLDHCAVSIDGAQSETHEWLRGVKGCFSKAIEAAKIVREEGINLQINTCIHDHNEHELPEIIHLAESLDARTIQLFFYVGSGRCDPRVKPPTYNSKRLLNINSKIPIRIIGDAQGKESKCCGAGDTVCCILNDGTVYPCMLLPVPVGNVLRNTLHDIWTDSHMIKKINEHKKKMPGCEMCRHMDIF